VVANAELALIEVCNEDFECNSTWQDRRTWEPVDRDVPTRALGRFGSRLLVGKWIVDSSGGFDGEIELFDIETGRTLETDTGAFANDIAISPDGRWLAVVGGNSGSGAVTLIDLTTEERFEPWLSGRAVAFIEAD